MEVDEKSDIFSSKTIYFAVVFHSFFIVVVSVLGLLCLYWEPPGSLSMYTMSYRGLSWSCITGISGCDTGEVRGVCNPQNRRVIRYANGVHLSAIWGNTALVQWIRCEPLGEHLISWTCAVFFHTALKWTPFVFSHTIVQNFQRRKEVYSRPTWQTTIRWWIADAQSITCTCYTACIQHVYMFNSGVWYLHTSHNENTTSECGNRLHSSAT